jgi:hypothetical protein
MQGELMKRHFGKIIFVIIFLVTMFLMFCTKTDAKDYDDYKVIPSPMEIRDYYPQPNRLMIVKYANERLYLFRIEEIVPRSDCNQIQFDPLERKIRIITQSVRSAYEYILEPSPIRISEWVPYDK